MKKDLHIHFIELKLKLDTGLFKKVTFLELSHDKTPSVSKSDDVVKIKNENLFAIYDISSQSQIEVLINDYLPKDELSSVKFFRDSLSITYPLKIIGIDKLSGTVRFGDDVLFDRFSFSNIKGATLILPFSDFEEGQCKNDRIFLGAERIDLTLIKPVKLATLL